jgi:membrane protein implicated in regulation of membrane protease activity
MILTLLSMAWSSELAALVWLAVALIAAIIEVSIPHFGFGFVSIGAVAAAGLAFVGYSVTVQMAVFVAVLSVSLLLLRSRLIGRLMSGRGLPSRTDVMIGRHGVVTHDIDATLGGGRVNVGGEDWAARSSDVIGSGTKVRVVGADGIVLEVTRA